jgi:signal transduction histidine kinase
MSVLLGLLVAGAGLAATIVVPALALAGLVSCARAFTVLQRSRFRVFLGEDPTATPHADAPWPWLARRRAEVPRGRLARAWATAWATATWRQIAYHLLAGVLGTFEFIAVAGIWCAALAVIMILAGGWGSPAYAPLGLNLRDPVVLTAVSALSAAALLVAPWIARGCAAVDLAVARALLGPSRKQERAELTQWIAGLAQGRSAMIEAADAERRRIERDLHDGAQQRLVMLSMNLGLARASLPDLPDPARQVLASAHDEVKVALAELRDFVRGLHPAVLSDRGLDAALSGLAARSPIPVRLKVNLPQRPSPATEAVAYFVASEAITNVVKHARATRVEVTVQQVGQGASRLSLAITDNGCGGARPESGSGLRGLARRVESIDGTLDVTSPPGGPTRVTVELPCAL